MTPQQSTSVLADALEANRVDFSRPHAFAVWNSIATYLRTSVSSDLEEASIGFGNHEEMAYVEFCRRFEHVQDAECIHVYVRLNSEEDDAPRFHETTLQAIDDEIVAVLIPSVESSRDFSVMVEYDNWRLELFQC